MVCHSSPRDSPGTPQAREEAGNNNTNPNNSDHGCGARPSSATIQVAAVGCSGKDAPNHHRGSSHIIMASAPHTRILQQSRASPRPSRSLSLPVLNKDIKASPGTPQARGESFLSILDQLMSGVPRRNSNNMWGLMRSLQD